VVVLPDGLLQLGDGQGIEQVRLSAPPPWYCPPTSRSGVAGTSRCGKRLCVPHERLRAISSIPIPPTRDGVAVK
jgi:hypothetical protein